MSNSTSLIRPIVLLLEFLVRSNSPSVVKTLIDLSSNAAATQIRVSMTDSSSTFDFESGDQESEVALDPICVSEIGVI